MHIGIDACCWSNKRGFGRFTRELLKALVRWDKQNEYLFFIDKDSASENVFPEEIDLIVTPTQVVPTQAASAKGRRSLRDLFAFSRQVLRHDLDVFFFPAVYSYFPILNRTKIIVTIHDLIADRHPDAVFPSKKLMYYWKLKQWMAVRQADLILTVSEHSKSHITQYFKIPDSKVKVILEAPSDIFTKLPRNTEMMPIIRRYSLSPDDRFLLYVGGISPHKNLGFLIEAFHRLISDLSFSDVKLVLVGDYKGDSFYSDYPAIKRLIHHPDLQGRIIMTGFVNDADLVYLYNAASLLVLPSLDEGFGLPVIEAMACGTPVIASDRGSLPEILGGAGRLFDPEQLDNLHEQLREVLGNPLLRYEMQEAGLVRQKEFSWDRAAEMTLNVFNELIDRE